MPKRTNWALCGLVGLLGAWVLVAGIREVQTARTQARMATCSSGLLEVRAAFYDYQNRHAGQFPPRLEDLDLTKGGPDALLCPNAQRLGRRAYLYIPPDQNAADDTLILICWRHPELLLLTKGFQFVRRR